MNQIKVDDLLQYWGTPFITILYRLLFDREPDDSGLAYYLNKLDKGIERVKIIEQLTSSPDSKIKLKDIKGATQVLNKIKSKDLFRKNLKKIKPAYLILSKDNQKSINERIILNRTYEIMYRLEGKPIANPSFLVQNEKNLANNSSSVEDLSIQEKQLYFQLLTELK